MEYINRITCIFFSGSQAIYPVFPGSLTLIYGKTVRFRRLCKNKNVLEQLNDNNNNNILILC